MNSMLASVPSVAKPASPARRWAGVTLVLALVCAAGLLGRYWSDALARVGDILVAEDSLVPVDVIVASHASGPAGAMEAARLYTAGLSPTIVLPGWTSQPNLENIRRLGIPMLSTVDLAATILERSGVPRTAIEVLPQLVDGTDTEVAALVAFTARRTPGSLLYITARSHTARARWMLRHELPPGMLVLVHSPDSTFASETWWKSRESTREVVTEYLRWVNVFVLGDLWARDQRHSSATQG